MSVEAINYRVSHYPELRVIHSENDCNVVDETRNNFIQGIVSTMSFLNIRLDLPFFNIFIAQDRLEFDRYVCHLTPTPTSKGRVGQPQALDLYLLSPNAYGKDASQFFLNGQGEYDAEIYERLIKHEVVHMFEEFLAPKGAMENQPVGWSSEGLAVYISRQYDSEQDIAEHMSKEISNIPDLGDFDGIQEYTWGWTIIDYIERKYGKRKILNFIQNSLCEDIFGFLDTNRSDFEKEWKQYARAEALKLI